MFGLTTPYLLDGTWFLRDHEDTNRLHRLPAPAGLLGGGVERDGASALGLTRYRLPPMEVTEGDEMGGGVFFAVIDVHPPSDAQFAAERALREAHPELAGCEVVATRSLPGDVGLWLGDTCLSRAPFSGGSRPMVGMAANLNMDAATLVHGLLEAGGDGLGVTTVAPLEAHCGNLDLKLKLALARCSEDLTGQGRAFAPSEACAAIDGLFESGAIVLEVVGTDTSLPISEIQTLGRILAAGVLFEPAPTGGIGWTLIPGLPAAELDTVAGLRLREGLTGNRVIQVAGGSSVSIPCFASGPLRPGPESPPVLHDLDAPGRPEQSLMVSVRGNNRRLRGVAVCVELDLPDGSREEWLLPAGCLEDVLNESRRFDYLRPGDTPARYRWRMRVLAPGSDEIAGEWRESTSTALMLDPAEFLRHMEVELVAHDLGDFCRSYLVELSAESLGGTVNAQFVLDGERSGAGWGYGPVKDHPAEYSYRITTRFKNDGELVGDWCRSRSRVIQVVSPLRGSQRIRLVVPTLEEHVETVTAELASGEPGDPLYQNATFTIAREETPTASRSFYCVHVTDEPAPVRYRLHWTFADGAVQQSEWGEIDGSVLALRPPTHDG